MKSQISRDAFRPDARYSGVYLQQGRMILDADWNELTELQKARLVDALRDAIGGGAPRTGGLALAMASGKVAISPGTLYVDGVPARIDTAAVTLTDQADYPVPLPVREAYADAGRRFYADVWERTVTALEQPALLDPGLHGADTATRSQTMLQVKWCAKAKNPLAEQHNPTVGDARLSVVLRSIVSDGDACNPCAIQVSVDERIGNYLFRVEVHDYDATTGWLTLKWSRDNGAEACAANAMPPGFNQGDWVWEFFDRDTERLLGNHLERTQDWAADYFPGANPSATGFVAKPAKYRGILRPAATLPAIAPAPAATVPSGFLRQWDGYLRINLASKALGGIDRGVALFAGAPGDDAQKQQKHGRVFLGDDLHINLERVSFTLSIKDRRFVAGDYWLAEIREARDGSGDIVLSAALPRGVRHHYLYLGELDGATLRTGELDGSGNLVADSADAYRRRMHFPALTDLRAHEIGFTDTCGKLFEGAQNVQAALDNLCHIAAEDIAFTDNCVKLFAGATNLQAALNNLCQIAADDIAYRLPDCSPNNGKSIKDRLLTTLDPDGDGRLTVEAALDNLLCRLDAGKLPYQVPDCAGTPSVRSLLQVAVGDNNVGPILTKLLCEFKANDLPLDKSDPELCVELKSPGIDTVQDALDLLCKTPASCALTVAVGQLERILRDFAARTDRTSLWLCLQPGEHPISARIDLLGKGSLRLSAPSASAARIRLGGGTTVIEAGEIIFDKVGWTVDAGSTLTLRGQRIRSEGCHYARTATLAGLPPMVQLETWDLGLALFNITPELFWRDNTMRDTWLRYVSGGVFTPDFTGETLVAGKLADLFGDPVTLVDPGIFEEKVKVAAEAIAAMPPEQIATWTANLAATRAAPRSRARAASKATRDGPLPSNLTLAAAIRPFGPNPVVPPLEIKPLAIPLGLVPSTTPDIEAVKPQVANIIGKITAAGGNVGTISGLLTDAIVATTIERGFGIALALADNLLSGSLCDNHVEGEIELKNGLAATGGDLAKGGLAAILRTPGLTTAGSLAISGNRLQRVWARLPAASVDTSDGIWTKALKGYRSITLSGNEFAGPENSFVGATVAVQGNRFHGNETATFKPTGVIFGNSVVVSGNTSGFNNNLAPLISATSAYAEAANLVRTKALLTS